MRTGAPESGGVRPEGKTKYDPGKPGARVRTAGRAYPLLSEPQFGAFSEPSSGGRRPSSRSTTRDRRRAGRPYLPGSSGRRFASRRRSSPSGRDDALRVGHLVGKGIVKAITFQAGYYGLSVGYRTDGGDLVFISNGECLKAWGADSAQARGLPARLLYWNGRHDLAIAVQTPLRFERSFDLSPLPRRHPRPLARVKRHAGRSSNVRPCTGWRGS